MRDIGISINEARLIYAQGKSVYVANMVSANQATASVEALKKANLVYNQSGKHLFDTHPEWRDTLTASYESAIQESSKGFKASMTALKGAGIMLTGVGVGLAVSEVRSLYSQGNYREASRAGVSFAGGVAFANFLESFCLSFGPSPAALACIAGAGAAGSYAAGNAHDVILSNSKIMNNFPVAAYSPGLFGVLATRAIIDINKENPFFSKFKK